MTSVLDYNLTDIPDEAPVEPGEYEMKVLSATHKISSTSGKPMVEVVLGVSEEPNARSVYTYLSLPAEKDDTKAINGKLRRLRSFYDCFAVDYEGGSVELDNLIGETGFCILSEEDDPEYGASNSVRRFLARK